MKRYVYVLVRCVPEPRTGEFINMAAIAGRPEVGDWSIRRVGNDARARKLQAGSEELGAVNDFLTRIGQEIEDQPLLLDEELLLDEDWLRRLYHDHRNVVQLSPPAPIVAETAEEALEIIFSRQIIDPVLQPRDFIEKRQVLAELRDSYRRAHIANALIRPKVEVYTGDYIHAPVDFAVANGTTLQLTQGWSFQRNSVDEVSMQVKAWGYALRLLREGQGGRVVDSQNRIATISSDVDLQVVVASPKNRKQEAVFDEAKQVFTELHVSVHDLDDVDAVGIRAASLLRDSSR